MARLKVKLNNPKVVLDIGHSKTRLLLADMNDQGQVSILTGSVLPSPSFEQTVVTKIEDMGETISAAISEVCKEFNCDVQGLDVAVGGEAVQGVTLIERMRLSGGVVTQKNLDAWLRRILKRRQRGDLALLDVINYGFVLDDGELVQNPVGRNTKTIKAIFHLLCAEKWLEKNLHLVLDKIGVDVDKMQATALAASYAATTEEQRRLGVCHIDIGEKNSSFSVWHHGVPIFSGALNQGGGELSQKIAERFYITHQTAQWLKNEHGTLSKRGDAHGSVALLGSGTVAAKKIELSALSVICEKVMHQFFSVIGTRLNEVYDRKLLQNVVLSGGGAQLNGMREFLEKRYKVNAHIVHPKKMNFSWLYELPDYLQEDAGIMTALGMLKLYYYPMPYQVWEKNKKTGIMGKLKKLFF